MSIDTDNAMKFFDACETGQGWQVCKAYCTPDASFSSQAEPLAEMQTLEQYTDWMKGLFAICPDASYELKSFGVDPERGNITAYAVFSGTHTGAGGPVSPTGKKTNSDYVYCMKSVGGKITHMTKIWNAGWAMKQLGWA